MIVRLGNSKEHAILKQGKPVGFSQPLPTSPAGFRLSLFQANGPDEEACPLCVCVFPPDLNSLSGSSPSTAFKMILEWGAGGVGAEADIDILRGVLVNIPASFVRATIVGQVSSGPQTRIAGYLAYGPQVAIARVKDTLFTGAMVAPQNVDFLIPAFASDLTVIRTPFTAPYTISFLDLAAVAIFGTWDVAASVQPSFYPIEIPRIAYRVRVSTLGADIGGVMLIFGLNL